MDDPSVEQLQYPSEEQLQRYDVQRREILAIFSAAEADKTLIPALGLRLNEALSDPALPHDYRFRYRLINVLCTTDSSQLELAREVLYDFARALQATGMSPEEADKTLEERHGALTGLEVALEEQRKEREACNEKYPPRFYA
jgi:hypothetical protein